MKGALKRIRMGKGLESLVGQTDLGTEKSQMRAKDIATRKYKQSAWK